MAWAWYCAWQDSQPFTTPQADAEKNTGHLQNPKKEKREPSKILENFLSPDQLEIGFTLRAFQSNRLLGECLNRFSAYSFFRTVEELLEKAEKITESQTPFGLYILQDYVMKNAILLIPC